MGTLNDYESNKFESLHSSWTMRVESTQVDLMSMEEKY